MQGAKKNVIFLVCDGLTYNMLVDKKGHPSPMPFVKSLMGDCLWCTEAYSHGPYTESAIKSVLHGIMPLEFGGYFVEHTSWEDSVFKAFKDIGYELFTSLFISYIPPEVTTEGAFSYNTMKANPMFSRYFKGKLDYYYDIWKKKQLTEQDFLVLRRFLDRTFESIFMVYGPSRELHDYTGIYTPYDQNDLSFTKREKFGLKQLKQEYDNYVLDKDTYINFLFETYSSNNLINLFNWKGSKYSEAAKKQKKWIKNEYSELFKVIKSKNRSLYIKNHWPSSKNIYNHLKLLVSPKHIWKGVEFFVRLYQSINIFDTSKMIGTDLQQVCTSAGGFIDQFIDWRKKTNTANKPYFAYLHFDEFHRPLSFISHETNDYDRLKKEFHRAQEYVSNLPANYTGILGFDLAAHYLDYTISRLFEYLKKTNELDDTIVVITADHGSSNCGETERFTCTNHFYKEQYHIPLIISGVKPQVIDGFVHGIDLLPTVSEIIGFPCHRSWHGDSIFHATHEYTTVEYTGGGVSDILRRPIKFGYRDKEKSFVVEGMISDNPEKSDIKLLEYYDLLCDPNEINNISNGLLDDETDFCKSFFIDRLRYLFHDYNNYLKEISKG